MAGVIGFKPLGLATMDCFENGLPEKLRRMGLLISELLELGLVLPDRNDGEEDLLDGSAMEMELREEFSDARGEKFERFKCGTEMESRRKYLRGEREGFW